MSYIKSVLLLLGTVPNVHITGFRYSLKEFALEENINFYIYAFFLCKNHDKIIKFCYKVYFLELLYVLHIYLNSKLYIHDPLFIADILSYSCEPNNNF